MFLVLCPKYIADIPSDFELLLHLFQVFRISRAGQILFMEFIKDGLADNRDKFTHGGSFNRPVILQGCAGFSYCQVSQRYCQFQSNLSALPTIGDWLLQEVVYALLNEVKKFL